MQTFYSCLVHLCWESYRCECLAVQLWIVEQRLLPPTFNQRSTLFSHVHLQMAAKIGDQPNMNSSSPVIDPSLYGFGGPKRTLDNGGKLLTTYALWICSVIVCLSGLWSLSVALKLLGGKNSRVDFADIEQIQSLFTLQPHDLRRQTHLTTADTMTMNKLGFHGNIVSHYPVV